MSPKGDEATPFVSYAQHGEDVILWRALGDRADVFYVDVGAYHPTQESVTRALYERGWRGMNIEAQPERLQAFLDERPDEINLAIALGDRDGTTNLLIPKTPGWASTLDATLTGTDPASRTIEVPVRRLDTIFAEYRIDHVDVLKIDVEGAEPAVVRGLLAGSVRPLVCVVEGVAPGIGRVAGDQAVGLLEAAGYVHCLFDGLNHYLTTDSTLVDALSVPAGPVDSFVTDLVARLHAERLELKALVENLQWERSVERELVIRLTSENIELRDSVAASAIDAPLDKAREGATDAEVAPANQATMDADHGTPAPVVDADAEDGAGSNVAIDLGDDADRGLSESAASRLLPAKPDRSTTPVSAVLDTASRTRRRRRMFVRVLHGLPTAPEWVAPLDPAPSLLAAAVGKRSATQTASLLYRAILRRDGSPDELGGWAGALEHGLSALDVATGISLADEALLQPAQHREAVQRDLETWRLLRIATSLGLEVRPAGAVDVVGTVADQFFVTAVYQAALLRVPTATEMAHELSRLGEGVGREWMIRTFANRLEVRDRIDGSSAIRRRSRLGRLRHLRRSVHRVATFRAMVLANEALLRTRLQTSLDGSRSGLGATLLGVGSGEGGA